MLLSPADAEALFRARYAAASGGAAPAPGPALQGLLERVDGLPVAVEHAAARAALVGLEALVSGPLWLSGGPLEDPLYRALDALWRGLDPVTQRWLARAAWLGIPFTLEDLAAVGGGDAPGAERAVAQLVAHALVHVERGADPNVAGSRREMGPAPRFRVVRPVAELAAPRLEAADLERACGHFVETARRALASVQRGRAGQTLAALESAQAPLRRAFEKTLLGPRRQGPGADAAADLALALELAATRRMAPDPRPDLDRALALRPDASRRCALLEARARWSRQLGDAAGAQRDLREAVQIARLAPDPVAEARARATLALSLERAGDPTAAEAMVRPALPVLAAAERWRDLAHAEAVLGLALVAVWRLDEAIASLQRAAALAERVGDPAMLAELTGILGNVAQRDGRLDEARLAYRRAIAAAGEADPGVAAIFGGYAATLADELDDAAAAEAAFTKALPILAEAGLRRHEALFAAALAGHLADRGALARAAEIADPAAAAAEALEVPDIALAVAVHRARLDVAWALQARLAARPSAVHEAARHLARARATLAAAGDAESDDVVVARRLLQRSMAAAEDPRSLLIDRRGVVICAARSRVDLGARPTLAGVLGVLAVARRDAPGETVGPGALLAGGWPGEQVLPEAGAKRVRTAIWALRKAGLGEALQTVGEAYRLDPRWPIRVFDPL